MEKNCTYRASVIYCHRLKNGKLKKLNLCRTHLNKYLKLHNELNRKVSYMKTKKIKKLPRKKFVKIPEKKVKPKIKVIPKIARLNTKRVRKHLTKEEWIKFKIYCIDKDIPVYKQLAQMVKSFLKKEKLI